MTVAPLFALFSDRRFLLLLGSSAVALLLAFIAIPDSLAIALVSRIGFWLVLIAFALWMRALWQTFGADIRAFRWSRIDWTSVAVVMLGGTVLLAHESFGFKIIMDELMLLGTSMSMHLDKLAVTPLRGNDVQGVFILLEGIVDKRPLFFPFLLSLVHDIGGYRPGNAFILNGILSFVFLSLIFVLGRLLAGRIAGWLGVALFAGLPLLAQNSTGGGFELLNLVMMIAALLLGARFIEKRDGSSLTAFCYSGVLLAQVRYESVIFLLPIVLIVLWIWAREGRATLTWSVIAAPLLMVHYPLQHRIFDLRSSSWELFSKEGYTKPFSLDYVPENLAHALQFFFGRASDHPNSLVLSALGCIAVPFFALLVFKRLRALSSESSITVSVTLFSLGFAAQFALMMCYFFKFDDVVTRRLSLPTHLGMVIAVLAILPQIPKPAVLRVLFGMAVLGLLARSVPSMAAHAYNQEYLPGLEVAWRRQFMAAQRRPDYLMIDNDATLWVTHKVSASPTGVARKERREDIAFFMRNRAFSDVFVFQRFNVDVKTGALSLRDGDDLGPGFVLEPVVEQRLQLLTLSRISRVKEIKSGDVSLTAPEPPPAREPRTRAEIEKARQQFLETYMKKLP
jgi:hypothetical protein